MRLFQIADALERLLADPAVIDLETGEITADGERMLDELEGERDARALDIAAYILGERCEAEAITAQAHRLLDRAKRHHRRADSLEGYLAAHLTPGMKLADARSEITWRKSSAVEVDETKLPSEWWREKVTRSPMKDELKKVLKTGKSVEGAELVERMNLSVK